MKKELKILEEFYGKKGIVADALGISPRHYSRLLNGTRNFTPTIKNLIRLMVKNIKLKKALGE